MKKVTPAPAGQDTLAAEAEDMAALRQAMRGVTVLSSSNHADVHAQRPQPLPRHVEPGAAEPVRPASAAAGDPALSAWLEATPLKGHARARAPLPAPETPPASQADSEFARLFGAASPVDTRNRVWLEKNRPPPLARQQQLDDQQVLIDSLSDHLPWVDEDDNGDELLFLRPGLSRDILRKLRQGDWVIQAEIDFHGCTVDEARQRFSAFMLHCLEAGHRCLRLVHGKGLSSRNREPVIKPKLRGWLIQREEVLAFCPARPFDGGNGAVIVLLRGRNRGAPSRDG